MLFSNARSLRKSGSMQKPARFWKTNPKDRSRLSSMTAWLAIIKAWLDPSRLSRNSCQIGGRKLRELGFILTAFALGGCATFPDMGNFAQSHREKPIKVMVSEVPLDIGHGRLQAVLAPDVKSGSISPDLARGILHAQKYALTAMNEALSRNKKIAIVTSPEIPDVNRILSQDFDKALIQADADLLREETGADALLRFRITDYGLTPKAWRDGYITFEVASTLAIAGVIAYSGSTAAKAAAGGYLAQETVEETTEAYAGFWALDVVARPVRMEAELIRLNPVSVIWKDVDTGLSKVRLSRLTRKVGANERNHQLDHASDHAVDGIATDFSKALGGQNR